MIIRFILCVGAWINGPWNWQFLHHFALSIQSSGISGQYYPIFFICIAILIAAMWREQVLSWHSSTMVFPWSRLVHLRRTPFKQLYSSPTLIWNCKAFVFKTLIFFIGLPGGFLSSSKVGCHSTKVEGPYWCTFLLPSHKPELYFDDQVSQSLWFFSDSGSGEAKPTKASTLVLKSPVLWRMLLTIFCHMVLNYL